MRITYWDYWKGISIIAVVLIHASGIAASYPIYSLNFNTGIIIRQFINFSVPVFLFISGYFSYSEKYSGQYQYIKKRGFRVTTPYLAWTIIYISIATYNGLFMPTVKNITANFLLGTGIGVGYFVIVLLQFVLITPILYKIKSIKLHILLLFLISILGVLYTYISNYKLPGTRLSQFPYSALPFFVWYPFFHLGFALSRFSPKIKMSNNLLYFLIVLGVIFSLLEGFIESSTLGYGFAVSQLKLSSLTLSTIICIVIYKNKDNSLPANNILVRIGNMSYGIYLTHMLFITSYGGILKGTYMNNNMLLYIFTLALLSLLSSILMVLLIDKLVNNRIKPFIIG
ncbi:acyltransferase [Hafnia paralvei]|uniref:acyltransferase n=1 Tax=Hafnia paralvei TaxID=546367 RepID=UPI0018F0680E|nr:acyltransferase [Hafnia paralvei]MBW2956309.1 acyltransferase [Hafnia paralvei]